MNEAIQSCGRLAGYFERAVLLDEEVRAEAHGLAHLTLARFTASLLRMRVGPAVAMASATNHPDQPLHVALFGGTNTGKSTLVNLLLGRSAAGMDVRARFSQHPEAYPPAGMGEDWLRRDAARFGCYRIYLNESPPRYSDADLERGQYVPALGIFEAPGEVAGEGPVLWDLPDFSTEQAQAYLPSVLDLAALADLLIMTVTDESYADARGVTLLGLLHDAGVRLLVVANRVSGGRELEEDIRMKIGAVAPEAGLFFLPHVKAETTAGRLRLLSETQEANALREAVAALTRERASLKHQALAGAADFLDRHLGEVLGPLEDEARHAHEWQDFVEETTRTQFLERYRTRYLDTEEYGEFRQTLLRVMEQLEIPWVSGFVRGVGEVIRTPLRLARNWIIGPETPRGALEEKILLELFTGWLAALKEFAQRRSQEERAPDWRDLAGLLADEQETQRLREGLVMRYARHRQQMQEEIARRTREIVEMINRNPVLRHSLKGLRLGSNVLSTSLAIASHGLNPTDLVLAPAVAAMTDWLWDALGRYYVEDQRRRLKQYQFESMRQLAYEALSDPAAGLIRARVTQQDMATAREDMDCIGDAVRNYLSKKGGA